ncbi:MAG: quinone oxidoreductase family protein [Candidatus Hodarchaeales archaeon]|jgi:NADPH2:quinone reductase
MRAIQIDEIGGPDKLVLKEVLDFDPKPNEVKIKLEYAGVNFIDIYYRKGVYKKDLPIIPGEEGAGIVIKVGENIKNFSVGDRVVYCMVGGSYSEYHCVPENRVVKIPDDIDTQIAVASFLQGLTVHYLTTSTFRLEPGMKAVVLAASGGVGLLLVQVAKLTGATVIAVTSTDDKMNLVKSLGADYAFNYETFEKNTVDSVGKVDLVYDSVGKNTFNSSLNILKPRGYLVLYGQSSGIVESFNPSLLAQKGSLFLTRPSLAHYILTSDELNIRADALFNWIRFRNIEVIIDSVFPLESAKEAHEKLEKRFTKGKLLLKMN